MRIARPFTKKGSHHHGEKLGSRTETVLSRTYSFSEARSKLDTKFPCSARLLQHITVCATCSCSLLWIRNKPMPNSLWQAVWHSVHDEVVWAGVGLFSSAFSQVLILFYFQILLWHKKKKYIYIVEPSFSYKQRGLKPVEPKALEAYAWNFLQIPVQATQCSLSHRHGFKSCKKVDNSPKGLGWAHY